MDFKAFTVSIPCHNKNIIFSDRHDAFMRMLCSTNENNKWVTQKELKQLNEHLYGVDIKNGHIIQAKLMSEDLQILTKLLEGYHDMVLEIVNYVDTQIDWSLPTKKDVAYRYLHHLCRKELNETIKMMRLFLDPNIQEKTNSHMDSKRRSKNA